MRELLQHFPYAWLGNNFVNRIDPNGMDWEYNSSDDSFWMGNDSQLRELLVLGGKGTWTSEDIRGDFCHKTLYGILKLIQARNH